MKSDSNASVAARPTLTHSAAFRITLGYLTGAALWILVSDAALAQLFGDLPIAALLGTLKGWLFVLVTAALLFGLLQRYAAQATTPLPGEPPLVESVAAGITGAGAPAPPVPPRKPERWSSLLRSLPALQVLTFLAVAGSLPFGVKPSVKYGIFEVLS